MHLSPMHLSPAQIAQYDRDGYLLFPDLLDAAEVAVLRREIARIARIESDMVFREGEGRVVNMKTLIAEHGEPVPIVGKPGSAVIFDCNLLHASGHNLSAQDRWQAYFCYNTRGNQIAGGGVSTFGHPLIV